MKTMTIGGSALVSGVLGLGCNRLADPHNADMVAVAHAALDRGVNQFDCADVYMGGKSELFLGAVVKPRRNEALIVSKCGIVMTPGGMNGVNGQPDYIRRCCDASLGRLGMDTIDLYYLHRPDPAVPVEDSVGALAGLVEAGKVKAIGLCNTTAELIRRAHKIHPIAAVQMEYSLMARAVEKDILPTCKELGITFVAYGPLTYAFLAGAVTRAEDLAPGDTYRRRQSRFKEENLPHNVKLLSVLDEVCRDTGAARAQVALAWCLHRPWQVLPIPGATKPHHFAENAGAADVRLSAAQVQTLDQAFDPARVKGGWN